MCEATGFETLYVFVKKFLADRLLDDWLQGFSVQS